MQKEVGSLGSTGIVRIFFPENSVSIQRIALFEYMRKVSIICLLIIFFLYLKKKRDFTREFINLLRAI